MNIIQIKKDYEILLELIIHNTHLLPFIDT